MSRWRNRGERSWTGCGWMNKDRVKGLCIWETGHVNLKMGEWCLRLLSEVQDTRWCPLQCSHRHGCLGGWDGVEILRGEDIKEVGNPGYWRATRWPPSGWWLNLFGKQSCEPCISVNEERGLFSDRHSRMMGTPEEQQGFCCIFFLSNKRGHMVPVWQWWVWGTSVPSGFKINVLERTSIFWKIFKVKLSGWESQDRGQEVGQLFLRRG